jgi:5S rRNA maturation endonuclease (ribonuclease M5)
MLYAKPKLQGNFALSSRLKEKEEKIAKILDALAEKSSKSIPIVVEGKKDVEALRAFNVAGPIITVKTGGKSLVEAIGEIEAARSSVVILLLDFDRRGRETTYRIKHNLEWAKINPELKFWRDLGILLARDVQSIESLPAYMATLKAKTA